MIDEADVKAGKVKVYAPSGFMEHVMSENVYAGNAMSRRAQFQFGSLLPRGERGQVDAGLGKSTPSGGTITLIAPFKGQVKDAAGKVIWDIQAYDFLAKDQAPESVNPSLWRLAQLSAHAGLFEVSPRLYQVRGLDLANMTIIEGDDGLIIIDPLTMAETAKAALELYYQNRPRKPVVAVIYSHTHVDHFGGVRGVIDEADVKAGKVKVFAPTGLSLIHI